MQFLEENKLYSNADMADWFHIQESSFRVTKKNKLELLKYFADFEEVRGKIFITEVRIPEYNKDIKNLVKQEFYEDKIYQQVSKSNLQNYTSLANNIFVDYPDELHQICHNSYKTVYYHANKVTKSMFIGTKEVPPTHGKCLGKKWCKTKLDDEYHMLFTPMLNIEYQDWCEIRKQKSKIVTANQQEVADQFELGEISESELRKITSDIFVQNYIYDARKEFCLKYGQFPGLAQEFQLSAF